MKQPLCRKHPRYKAIRFPTAKCGDCKNAWMMKHSNPGDTITLFDEDGSPMGHAYRPIMVKAFVVHGTLVRKDFYR
jgi:hypothetical protein